MGYTPLRDVGYAVARQDDFDGHSIKGRSFPHGCGRIGSGLGTVCPPPGCTYVVWSYATPIAWIEPDGTRRITTEGFSQTTSRHVSCIPWDDAHRERREALRAVHREGLRLRAERRKQQRRDAVIDKELARLDALAERQVIACLTQLLVDLKAEQPARNGVMRANQDHQHV